MSPGSPTAPSTAAPQHRLRAARAAVANYAALHTGDMLANIAATAARASLYRCADDDGDDDEDDDDDGNVQPADGKAAAVDAAESSSEEGEDMHIHFPFETVGRVLGRGPRFHPLALLALHERHGGDAGALGSITRTAFGKGFANEPLGPGVWAIFEAIATLARARFVDGLGDGDGEGDGSGGGDGNGDHTGNADMDGEAARCVFFTKKNSLFSKEKIDGIRFKK
jgi:hypothetical protein